MDSRRPDGRMPTRGNPLNLPQPVVSSDLPVATKITVVGSISYVAQAAPGTAQSDNKWQAYKIDTTSGTVVTFADGNSDYDNVATDLTILNYS